MKRLLKNGYRHKARPSGHNISAKFRSDNKGSIPPNLIALGNNDSNSAHRRYCQEHGLVERPRQPTTFHNQTVVGDSLPDSTA